MRRPLHLEKGSSGCSSCCSLATPRAPSLTPGTSEQDGRGGEGGRACCPRERVRGGEGGDALEAPGAGKTGSPPLRCFTWRGRWAAEPLSVSPLWAEDAEEGREAALRDRSHIENTLKLKEDKPVDDYSGTSACGDTPACGLCLRCYCQAPPPLPGRPSGLGAKRRSPAGGGGGSWGPGPPALAAFGRLRVSPLAQCPSTRGQLRSPRGRAREAAAAAQGFLPFCLRGGAAAGGDALAGGVGVCLSSGL